MKTNKIWGKSKSVISLTLYYTLLVIVNYSKYKNKTNNQVKKFFKYIKKIVIIDNIEGKTGQRLEKTDKYCMIVYRSYSLKSLKFGRMYGNFRIRAKISCDNRISL